MISRGAPAKFTSHKGSWGDRAIIENPNESKKVSCSKCIHFNADKSCNKKPLYVPENGYNYWKQCDKFIISEKYLNEYTKDKIIYIKGFDYYESMLRKVRKEKQSNVTVPVINKAIKQVSSNKANFSVKVKFEGKKKWFFILLSDDLVAHKNWSGTNKDGFYLEYSLKDTPKTNQYLQDKTLKIYPPELQQMFGKTYDMLPRLISLTNRDKENGDICLKIPKKNFDRVWKI